MPNFIDNISPAEVKLYGKSSDGSVGFVEGFPKLLAQRAVPVIIVPNGTVATNGTITLGTALAIIYANAWIYLPDGAVVGGSAGLYFCQFASTTVGQVFTNFNDASSAFVPDVITSGLANAVGSNSAYTQTVATELTVASVTIPAGAIGNNGSLTHHSRWSWINNGNNKYLYAYIGVTRAGLLPTVSTTSSGNYLITGYNRGVNNSQIWGAGNSDASGTSTGALLTSAENTANDLICSFKARLVDVTDYIVLEAFRVEVRKS